MGIPGGELSTVRATTLRKVDDYIPCDIALEDKCGVGDHPLLEFGPLHS